MEHGVVPAWHDRAVLERWRTDDAPQHGAWRKLGVVVVVSAVLVLAAIGLDRADLRAETGLPLGAHDFIAYWAAFEVTSNGGDPYDEPSLRAAELDIHPRYAGGAQRFWNPPWTLFALEPVLALPFELATSVWLLISFAAAALCAAASWTLFVSRDEPIPPLALGASLLFVPVFECLLLGQMGAVIAFTTIGGLLALREGRDDLAGVLLAMNVLKPQVAAFVLVAIAVHVLATRRWKVLGYGMGTIGVLVIGSFLVHRSAWESWAPLEGSPTEARAATIASWIRSLLPATTDGRPAWPLAAVPVAAVVFLLAWMRRSGGRIVWESMPTLLVVSLLVTPYAAVYDGVLMIPIQVIVIGALLRRRRGSVPAVIALFALQAAALAIRSLEASALHHMIVVPLAMLALSLAVPSSWTCRSVETGQQATTVAGVSVGG